MGKHLTNASVAPTEAYAPTSELPLTVEEENAIVTLVVVVIGIIVAIVVLFCMGIFIDCKHQKDTVKKRRLRLRMPPLTRARRGRRDDAKALAADMCPNGTSDGAYKARDAIV